MTPRVLIAGVGNIFLGDDAFGVEVVRRLAGWPGRTLPDGVRVIDFGIRGLDLAYALCDGYDAVIVVDAALRGRPPGTLYVIEPDLNWAAAGDRLQDAYQSPHALRPVQAFRLAQELGGRLPWLRVVGCEPASLGPAETLSEPVGAAVAEAILVIETLLQQIATGVRSQDGDSDG